MASKKPRSPREPEHEAEADLVPAEVIRRTRTVLEFVDIAQALASTDPTGESRAVAYFGAYSVAIYGRAVTNVLQTMRSAQRVDRSDFDAWYAPHQDLMRSDEMLAWFYALRTQLLKEGRPEMETLRTFQTREVNPGEWRWVSAHPPRLNFPSPPKTHLGELVASETISDLGVLYLQYLTSLVDLAEDRWVRGGDGGSG